MTDLKQGKSAVKPAPEQETVCYHCGSACVNKAIAIEGKKFCCEGCKVVYELLNENGLCDYYTIQHHPGLSQIKPARRGKYAFLDSEEIAAQLYGFTDGNNMIVTFYIPGIHCSSCLWLLEHMHQLDSGITESRLNFSAKELTVHFRKQEISLRKVVELLTTIGYEPHISLEEAGKKQLNSRNKKRIYKLGVAGFCFGNIMLMSFPEYLGGNGGIEHQYARLFRILNLILSVPVFFYSASEFFASAWAGIRQRLLNIDAPVVLALVITYTRSLYEIFSGTGGGYLDSMSGIVFFMLAGRVVQERTYRSVSFHRDYKAYFPIAVDVITQKGAVSKHLRDLKENDIVQLHNDEIIPADALLVEGVARIDYSFVTGESEPVHITEGAMLYAGGKQTGGQIKVRIIKPVAGSYLTSLWNHYAFRKNKTEQNDRDSVIHTMAQYFTWVLFILAAGTALYWWWHDPSKILPSVSAMLIVACPCALLLAATYTNGNLLRIFSNNGLFLRDAHVIEQIGKVDHIVFDKTGTLTQGSTQIISSGHQMSAEEKDLLYNVVQSSSHPYSKLLALHTGVRQNLPVTWWKEYAGQGIEAVVAGRKIRVGNNAFLDISPADTGKASVYVRIGSRETAFYIVPEFREAIPDVISALNKGYRLSLLSGDNDNQRGWLRDMFAPESELLFEQKPVDKLEYIEQLQRSGTKVMMMGDGLNDAGALQQSNVGITLADDVNNFTPSCDAILDARKFAYLPGLLRLAKSGKYLISLSFCISILYNIVGLAVSMQGKMSPMIAAVLMPASTLSIVMVSTGISSLVARKMGLSLQEEKI